MSAGLIRDTLLAFATLAAIALVCAVLAMGGIA
jgi:hypothetical protein